MREILLIRQRRRRDRCEADAELVPNRELD